MFPRQYRSRVALAMLCAVVAMLAGCGGVSASGPVAGVPNDTNLNGNWLLVGTLPFASVTGTPQNNNFGVASTFSVVGNALVGALSLNLPCTGGGVPGPAVVLTGTIANDGSFTSQNAVVASPITATLTGSVPSGEGNSWSGHLNLSSGSLLPCNTTQSMNFTAVRVANVTGTYTGATMLNGNLLSPPNSQAVTLSLVLQQGSFVTDAEGLTGTVNLQGSSCLTSGVVQLGSGVLGSVVVMQVSMNDGSTMLLDAQISNTGALSLNFEGGFITGGTCGFVSVSPALLTKQ